ncbi:MAG: DUF547 domain-containing protein [Colwelliaceae bacterium]|nr:DUF547 domain-containing protein [Colwelliaceae bacterium]
MNIKKVVGKTAFLGLLFCASSTALANEPATDLSTHFSLYAQSPTLAMDFTVVNQLLHAGVINMGRSTRSWAANVRPSTGTRMRHNLDSATDNETNRFFYENLKEEQKKIVKLRKNLESIPTETPLHLYTQEQQLAYWLNLYNVSVINEIAKLYPVENLQKYLASEPSFFNKKLLNVNNVSISLNDIQYDILPSLYKDEALIIYGLYQGYRGSPNIRKKAYTGENVLSALKDNAEEFINSNRGTQFNGKKHTVRVSHFYHQNRVFFPNFQNDLKKHLLEYSDKSISEKIANSKELVTNIKNYRTADIYGTFRHYEGSVATSPLDQKSKMTHAQLIKMRELMRVRAINLGGGSVTVTDIETEDN